MLYWTTKQGIFGYWLTCIYHIFNQNWNILMLIAPSHPFLNILFCFTLSTRVSLSSSKGLYLLCPIKENKELIFMTSLLEKLSSLFIHHHIKFLVIYSGKSDAKPYMTFIHKSLLWTILLFWDILPYLTNFITLPFTFH